MPEIGGGEEVPMITRWAEGVWYTIKHMRIYQAMLDLVM